MSKENYWKKRCELAEQVIDMVGRQTNAGYFLAHQNWLQFKVHQKPDSPSPPVDAKINPAPKPYTGEMIAFLLVNALRNLNKEQFHNLSISLAVRDGLFTIEEYEKQKQG